MRKWLTEHVDRLLNEQGIDLYRQDFNMDPLGYWRGADSPDRQGISEIKHVTGYLAYWDELRRRHPKMLIDSCASGGRRNDLETMRRAVPLWRSDYAFEAIGHQCMMYGLSLWLPFHGTGTVCTRLYSMVTTPNNCERSVNCTALRLTLDGSGYQKIRVSENQEISYLITWSECSMLATNIGYRE